MELDEAEKVKRALQFIKIARGCDWIRFNALIASDEFGKEVIESLEQVLNWSSEDEELIPGLIDKFLEKTEGKTMKEKRDKLTRIFKIAAVAGGLAAALAGAGAAGFTLGKKQNQKTEE